MLAGCTVDNEGNHPPGYRPWPHRPIIAQDIRCCGLGKGEFMLKLIKRSMILFLILALLAVPWCAMAASEMEGLDHQISAAAMASDAILIRPIGLVSTVLGFGLFVISSPFSALGGNIGDAWRTMVARPAKFTFVRPLGDFD